MSLEDDVCGKLLKKVDKLLSEGDYNLTRDEQNQIIDTYSLAYQRIKSVYTLDTTDIISELAQNPYYLQFIRETQEKLKGEINHD